MSTFTSSGVLAIDGHVFHREPQVWADTEAYDHLDCNGADFHLVRVGDSWSWWVKVSPDVTLRDDPDRPKPLDAWAAFDAAQAAASNWWQVQR